jgi:hypothetical protein
MLEMVLQEAARWHRLYLVAKRSHMGVNVDGLSYPPTPSYCLRVSDWSAEFLVRDCTSLLGCQASPEGDSAQAVPHAVSVRLGPRALGYVPPCLITSRGTMQDSHCPFLMVRDMWGSAPCSGGEGLSARVIESVKKGFYPYQRGFSYCGGDYASYAC